LFDVAWMMVDLGPQRVSWMSFLAQVLPVSFAGRSRSRQHSLASLSVIVVAALWLSFLIFVSGLRLYIVLSASIIKNNG
jgi:hypothetical protein